MHHPTVQNINHGSPKACEMLKIFVPLTSAYSCEIVNDGSKKIDIFGMK